MAKLIAKNKIITTFFAVMFALLGGPVAAAFAIGFAALALINSTDEKNLHIFMVLGFLNLGVILHSALVLCLAFIF